MRWGWTFLQFSRVTFFSLILSVSGFAANVNIDLVDGAGVTTETWKWSGEVSCSWDDKDLVVRMTDESNKGAMQLRVPGLKRYLKNPTVQVDLDSSKPSEFKLLHSSKMLFEMVPQGNQPWLGSKCSVNVDNAPKDASLRLAVACTGLKESENKISGLMNLSIPELSCLKK